MKSNLDSIFKSNTSLEQKGIWLEINESTAFLVKRYGGSNSHEISKKLAELSKPYVVLIDKNMLPPEKDKEIVVRSFVETSILDWRGIDIDKEKDVKFTHEAATQLLISLPDLHETLVRYASDAQNYLADMGNS